MCRRAGFYPSRGLNSLFFVINESEKTAAALVPRVKPSGEIFNDLMLDLTRCGIASCASKISDTLLSSRDYINERKSVRLLVCLGKAFVLKLP